MTKMYVNLNNIKYNLDNIKKKLNKDTTIIAMVKANSYGLGDVEVSKFLENNGINFFGVAYVSEGVRLRNNNISSNILVTGIFNLEDFEDIVNYNLCISVPTLENLDKLNDHAMKKNKIIKIHLKIETGMSRLGFKLDELPYAIDKILDLKNICIDGIYTHLSSADVDRDYTLKQIDIFKHALSYVQSLGIEPSYIHCLNSSGIINFPEYSFNTVRVGDCLYGYYPASSLRNKISLKPSVKITANISQITDYIKGTKISYNQNYTLEKDSKVAVVQMGYADGLFRSLSNKYEVIVKRKKCIIIGNICMDMFMCDVSEINDLTFQDEVAILDYDDSIYEMCDIIGTINYEILSKISPRVKRVYIQ